MNKNDVCLGLKAPKAVLTAGHDFAVIFCLSQKWNYVSLWLALLRVEKQAVKGALVKGMNKS